MKLLVELANEQDVEILVEQTAQGKKAFLEGKWAAVDEEVRNGRTYPSSVMETALAKYNADFIQNKRALGELNHPANPTVNLDRASHLIEKLSIQSVGGKRGVYGKARIMESTPMGAIAKALIEEGVKLGVSTRGLGSIVVREGKKYVHNDFMLNAIDIVSDPSGPGCYPTAMFESVDYEMLEDGRIIQLAVDKAKNRINEETLYKEFQKLMSQLTGK